MSDQATEELLLAGMARFTADVTAAPEGLAARVLRHRRRRRIATAATMGGTVAAAAVIAAAVVTAPRPAGPASHDAQAAADVISRTESALGTVSSENFIESIRVRISPRGVEWANIGPVSAATSFAEWVYDQRVKLVTYTGRGELAIVSGWHGVPVPTTTTTVDYLNRTWWRSSSQGTSVPRAPMPACRTALYATLQAPVPESYHGDVAAALRTALRCGRYALGGTQRVDGVAAVMLRLVPSPDARGSRVTFWVDPASYLPVRSVEYYSDLGGVIRTQTDYQWLQPTSVHLAVLHLAIPSGFSQIPAPATP